MLKAFDGRLKMTSPRTSMPYSGDPNGFLKKFKLAENDQLNQICYTLNRLYIEDFQNP